VAESDNLVALQEQIRGCDGILGKMESLLGGFQSDLGKISSEVRRARALPGNTATDGKTGAHCVACAVAQIKSLQEQSFTMSIKLRNRKAAEAQLGQFVEDISLPPKLISAIVDGEVRHSGYDPRTRVSRLPAAHLTQRTPLRPPNNAGERHVRAEPGAAAHEAGVYRFGAEGVYAVCAALRDEPRGS
jgi:hypothetical protein